MANATALQPAVDDTAVWTAINELTAGFQLERDPRYNPDVWAGERADPNSYVPLHARERTVGLVHVYLTSRADVDRMAEQLGGAEIRDEDGVTVLTDPDDWYVTRSRRFRVADWPATGVNLVVKCEEARIAPAPEPRARRAVAR